MIVVNRTLGQAWNDQNRQLSVVTSIEITRKIISGIMNAYAKARNKEMWCEKTPLNIAYLENIETIFPDAKFICLYRNCLDVVHSCIEAGRFGYMAELAPYIARNPENIVSALMESWVEKTEKILKLSNENSGKAIDIKYENMVTEPKAEIAKLFHTLNLEWEDGLLERALRIAHDPGGGDGKILNTSGINMDSIGKGALIPLYNIPHRLIGRVNELHDILGYKPISSKSVRQQ
jgi:hypothetical protein